MAGTGGARREKRRRREGMEGARHRCTRECWSYDPAAPVSVCPHSRAGALPRPTLAVFPTTAMPTMGFDLAPTLPFASWLHPTRFAHWVHTQPPALAALSSAVGSPSPAPGARSPATTAAPPVPARPSGVAPAAAAVSPPSPASSSPSASSTSTLGVSGRCEGVSGLTGESGRVTARKGAS